MVYTTFQITNLHPKIVYEISVKHLRENGEIHYTNRLDTLFLFISNSRIKLLFAKLSRLQFFDQVRFTRQVHEFVFIK